MIFQKGAADSVLEQPFSLNSSRHGKGIDNRNNYQKCKTVSICGIKIHVTGEHMEDRKLRGIIEIHKILNV